MTWFQSFLTEVANDRGYQQTFDREYQQTFDRSLTLLFDGFPDHVFPALKRGVDLDDLMRSLRADGNSARESAVYAAITLIGAVVATLNNAERQAAIAALERHGDPNNSVCKGFQYMLHVVGQLGVKPALLSRISCEIVGQLRRISSETIQAWWNATEVPRLADEVVRVEASAQKIAQRFAPRTDEPDGETAFKAGP